MYMMYLTIPFIPMFSKVLKLFVHRIVDHVIMLTRLLKDVVKQPFQYLLLAVSVYIFFLVLDKILLRKKRPLLVIACCTVYISALEWYDRTLEAAELFLLYVLIFAYLFTLPRFYKYKPVRLLIQNVLVYGLFSFTSIRVYCVKILQFHILVVSAVTAGCLSLLIENKIIRLIKGEEEFIRIRRNSAVKHSQE